MPLVGISEHALHVWRLLKDRQAAVLRTGTHQKCSALVPVWQLQTCVGLADHVWAWQITCLCFLSGHGPFISSFSCRKDSM